jgi:hypothetical protein
MRSRRDETRSLSRILHSFLMIALFLETERGYALPARLTCTCRACARMHVLYSKHVPSTRERRGLYCSTTILALLTQSRKTNLLYTQLHQDVGRCPVHGLAARPPRALVSALRTRGVAVPCGPCMHAKRWREGPTLAAARPQSRPPRLCPAVRVLCGQLLQVTEAHAST